jgi:hypothetical protein
VSWTACHRGSQAVEESHVDRAELRSPLDQTQVLEFQTAAGAALTPGACYTASVTFSRTLSSGRLRVFVDFANQIAETDETNNFYVE